MTEKRPAVYTVKARRSRTLWQEAVVEITESHLAAKLAELGEPPIGKADALTIKLALEAVVDDHEFSISNWETDNAETNDLRVTEVNGDRVRDE